MIKQLTKLLCHHLLKVEWIRREVEAYKLEQKKQRHHECWAKLMQSGSTVRVDDDMIADYNDTRMIGQRSVEPRIVRPFGLRKQ